MKHYHAHYRYKDPVDGLPSDGHLYIEANTLKEATDKVKTYLANESYTAKIMYIKKYTN